MGTKDIVQIFGLKEPIHCCELFLMLYGACRAKFNYAFL